MCAETCTAIRAGSPACTHEQHVVRTARRLLEQFRDGSRHRHLGVSNPPGRPRDGGCEKPGVPHAPAPSATLAKCVSRAAQNAALLVLPFSLQVVRCKETCERSPRGHRFTDQLPTDNLAFPNCANHRSLSRPPSRRQPFPSRIMKPGWEALRKPRRCASEMPSGFGRHGAQSVRRGEGDENPEAWCERPRLWPRA